MGRSIWQGDERIYEMHSSNQRPWIPSSIRVIPMTSEQVSSIRAKDDIYSFKKWKQRRKLLGICLVELNNSYMIFCSN